MQSTIGSIKTHRLWYLAVGVLAVVLIGLIDRHSGGQSSFMLLYLFPVSLSAWLYGRLCGLITAVASTVIGILPAAVGVAQSATQHRIMADGMIALAVFAMAAFWVTRLKRTIRNEQLLARTDYTTGAVNTRYFHDLTEMEIRRFRRYQHPFTVAFIDLDNFKVVNDSLGHQAGDDVLRIVTQTLRMNLRDTDTVARMGGDEFALLLPETGEEEAHSVLSHLQGHLLAAMRKIKLPVTFSVGVVTYHAVPDTVEEIVRRADDLMYSVKRGGKNRVAFNVVAA